MADTANIFDFLEEARNALIQDDYLRAAIASYWCIQYCKYGELYGMSSSDLNEIETIANRIYHTSSKRIKSITLSKTTFVYGTICQKLLWLHKNKYNLRVVSPNTQKKFDAGHHIGYLAQKMFPDGIDASTIGSEMTIDGVKVHLPFNLKQYLWIDKTNSLYKDRTIFEAAFVYDDVFAAIDILYKSEAGHIAYEVKSSKSITDTIINDCALQYYVINYNCPLDDFFLIYLNEDYLNEVQLSVEDINESNVDIDKLFIKESVLSRILILQKDIAKRVRMCKSVLKEREPKIKMGNQCSSPYECMYRHYCLSSKTRQ